MPSQIEMLEREIARHEAKHGSDSKLLPHLKTQLASLKRQEAQRAGLEKPRENPVQFQVGMQGKRR